MSFDRQFTLDASSVNECITSPTLEGLWLAVDDLGPRGHWIDFGALHPLLQ